MNPQLERFLTMMLSNNPSEELARTKTDAAMSSIPVSSGMITGSIPGIPASNGKFTSQPQAQMQTGVSDASQDAGMSNAFDPEAAVYAQGLPPSPSNINRIMDSQPRGKEAKDVEAPGEEKVSPIQQKSNATPFAAGLDAMMARQGLNIPNKLSPLPMKVDAMPQTPEAGRDQSNAITNRVGGVSGPPQIPGLSDAIKGAQIDSRVNEQNNQATQANQKTKLDAFIRMLMGNASPAERRM